MIVHLNFFKNHFSIPYLTYFIINSLVLSVWDDIDSFALLLKIVEIIFYYKSRIFSIFLILKHQYFTNFFLYFSIKNFFYLFFLFFLNVNLFFIPYYLNWLYRNQLELIGGETRRAVPPSKNKRISYRFIIFMLINIVILNVKPI